MVCTRLIVFLYILSECYLIIDANSNDLFSENEDVEHICWENKTVTISVLVSKLERYYEQSKRICIDRFPPICTNNRVLTRTVKEPQTMEKLELVSSCCKGYRNIDGKCKPVCSAKCFSQDDCIAPDYCVNCRDGYYGPFCDKECPLGFYTKFCNVSCNCSPNGHYRCDSEVGCICVSGFQGAGCDIPVATNPVQERITTVSAVESAHISVIYMLIPVLLIILVLITLYYKKKITSLKDTINSFQVYTYNGSNYVKNFFPNPNYDNGLYANKQNKVINPKVIPAEIIIKSDFEKGIKSFDSDEEGSVKVCSMDVSNGHLYQTIEADNNLYEGLK